jgi:hypothetical protein
MVLQHGDVVVQVGQLAAGVTQESTEKENKLIQNEYFGKCLIKGCSNER